MTDRLPGQLPDTTVYGTGENGGQLLEVADDCTRSTVRVRVFAPDGRGMSTLLDPGDVDNVASRLLRVLGHDLDSLLVKAAAWDEAVSSGLLDDETASGLLGDACDCEDPECMECFPTLYSGDYVGPDECANCGDPEDDHVHGVYCRPTRGLCPCGSGDAETECCLPHVKEAS